MTDGGPAPEPHADAVEPVRRAKEAVEADLLARAGVTGVDVGFKEVGGRTTGTLAIRVMVERKRDDVPDDERIPRDVDGIATDVIERRFSLHALAVHAATAATNPDGAWYPVLAGGMSLGPCRVVRERLYGGTAGALVRDRATGAPMLLANFHVVCVDRSWSPGDWIAQPSRLDAATGPAAVAGVLRRAVLGDEVDAAVVEVVRGASPAVLDIGPVPGTRTARLGEAVAKRGRTTRLTFGSVDSLHLTVVLDYGPGVGAVVLREQLGVKADPLRNPVFAAVGDSGALVIGAGGLAVGLHVAGDDAGYGVANPIGAVLNRLGVDLWAPPAPSPWDGRGNGGWQALGLPPWTW